MQGSEDEPHAANPHLGSYFVKHQQANTNNFRKEVASLQLSEESHQMPALELDQGLGLAATLCEDRPRDSPDSRAAKLRTPRIANSCPTSGTGCNSEGCQSRAVFPRTEPPEPCLRHRHQHQHHHDHHHRARSVSFCDVPLEWPVTHSNKSLRSTQCPSKSVAEGHSESCQPGNPCSSVRQAKVSHSHSISLPVSLVKPAQPLSPHRQNKAAHCRFSPDAARCANVPSHSSPCPVTRTVPPHSYHSMSRHIDASRTSPVPVRHAETPPVPFSPAAGRYPEPTHSCLTPDTARCPNMLHSHSGPAPLRHEQTLQPHVSPPPVHCANKSHCHSNSGSPRLCRSHLSPDSARCANTSHSHSMPTRIKHTETPGIPPSPCPKKHSQHPRCHFPRDSVPCANASHFQSDFCPTSLYEPPQSPAIPGPVRHTAIPHSQPVSTSARCANTSHSHSAPALTKRMPAHQSNLSQDAAKQTQRPQTAFSLIPIGGAKSGDGQVR
ncbi:uncharacterized protein LOC125448801 [Stegostoma tigrinum]|uniref:uncharacterized protein LOC125448801 n=1 Tax=Stegostoma tigrinum TaxID=3053191 RepID=UPI00202B4A5C|nr:uncharacterized protein LOC125448801 [Stegostoma tigrinum]XP_059498614.1 uncharacterized protein LOC125448801 [Stegostoma tigrinum]